MSDGAVTPLQIAFLNHPDALTDPMKAAVEVGFSESFARAKSHQLRNKHLAVLVEKMRARLEGLGVTPEWVKNEVVVLARSAPADFVEFIEDDKGNQYSVLKKTTEIDQKKWRAAIKEVEFDTYIDASGAIRSRVCKLKFYDRQAALVELANLFGMKNEKILMALLGAEKQQKTEDQRLLEAMTPEELEQIAAIQESAIERLRRKASGKRDARAIEGKVLGSGGGASSRKGREAGSDTEVSASPPSKDEDEE